MIQFFEKKSVVFFGKVAVKVWKGVLKKLVYAYRFGFNGMEKDDEVKGSGNWLQFGDFGYDPRTGRRINIDPLSAKFPYESNYSFVSNNPILYKDDNGQKKTIYIKYINETTGETKIYKNIVSNELHPIANYTIHNRDNWRYGKSQTTSVEYEWYDINQVNTLTIKKDGSVESTMGNETIGQYRTTTNSMSQGWANFKNGDLIKGLLNESEQRGKQAGGFHLVSTSSNTADGPKTDATEENPETSFLAGVSK